MKLCLLCVDLLSIESINGESMQILKRSDLNTVFCTVMLRHCIAKSASFSEKNSHRVSTPQCMLVDTYPLTVAVGIITVCV